MQRLSTKCALNKKGISGINAPNSTGLKETEKVLEMATNQEKF